MTLVVRQDLAYKELEGQPDRSLPPGNSFHIMGRQPALLRMWDKRQMGYRAMGYRVEAGREFSEIRCVYSSASSVCAIVATNKAMCATVLPI